MCAVTVHERRHDMTDRKDRVPKQVYFQCIWIVKDIERLKRLEAIGNYSQEGNEMVFFVDEEDVIRNAAVLKQAAWKLECIRKAIAKLPKEYRQATIDSIVFNVPYGDVAHENTWRKWRQVFIRELAKNLLLI